MHAAGRKLLEYGGRATADQRLLPAYLIVGAKRSGTTSLQHYLTRHPAVLAPHAGKGTRYFDVNYPKGERWFRGHFPTRVFAAHRERQLGTRVVTGEASPYYCFHPSSFERIAAVLPDVRLVFVLRHPVDRALSHYHYEARHGWDSVGLEEALELEPARLAGEEERLRADDGYVSFAHRHWSYEARGHYVTQLDRARQHFDESQLLVLTFDELTRSPQAAMDRVHGFLGLPRFASGHFPVLERGMEEASPDPVRRRLAAAYAETADRLFTGYGIDFR